MQNKATFRALREQVGYSQAALADLLNVNIRSVKRWEHENYSCEPPEEAWGILENALEVQQQMVAYSIQVAKQQEANFGKKPKEITLNYFRDQDMYDRYGRDEGYFGVANANAKAAGGALKKLGFNIVFVYPTAI